MPLYDVIDAINTELVPKYDLSGELDESDYIAGRESGASAFGEVFRFPVSVMPADKLEKLKARLDNPSGIVIKLAYPDDNLNPVPDRFETKLINFLLTHQKLARKGVVRQTPSMFYRVDSWWEAETTGDGPCLVVVREDIEDVTRTAGYSEVIDNIKLFRNFDLWYTSRQIEGSFPQGDVPVTVMVAAMNILANLARVTMGDPSQYENWNGLLSIMSQVPGERQISNFGEFDRQNMAQHELVRQALMFAIPPGSAFNRWVNDSLTKGTSLNDTFAKNRAKIEGLRMLPLDTRARLEIMTSLFHQGDFVSNPPGIFQTDHFELFVENTARPLVDAYFKVIRYWGMGFASGNKPITGVTPSASPFEKRFDSDLSGLNEIETRRVHHYLATAMRVGTRFLLDALDLSLFCDHYGIYVSDLHSGNIGMTVTDPLKVSDANKAVAKERAKVVRAASGGDTPKQLPSYDWGDLAFGNLPGTSAKHRIRLIARDIGIGSFKIQQANKVLANDSRALAGIGWRTRW